MKELQTYNKEVKVKASTRGTWWIGFPDWDELEEAKERIAGSDIHLLSKRDGDQMHTSLGYETSPYDRRRDFEDDCEVFEYADATNEEVYVRCFKHRFEAAINLGETWLIQELLDDFNRVVEAIDLMNREDILVIDEYLNADVVERYPMHWQNDVTTFDFALYVPNED